MLKLTIYFCYVVDFRILIISERIVSLSDEIKSDEYDCLKFDHYLS